MNHKFKCRAPLPCEIVVVLLVSCDQINLWDSLDQLILIVFPFSILPGERCVHIAASVTCTEKNKLVEVMRELVVRSGADVNAREGKAGYTALHMAVERNDRDLVKFLLNECSSVNLEVASYGRWTAYQIAMVNRNQVGFQLKLQRI